MAFRAVVANAWQNITDARVVVGGVARRPLSMRAVVGGFWQNVYDYDKTGPGPVTGLTAQWDNSAASNKAIVSWTQPADTDFVSTYLEVNRTGSSSGPWTFVGLFTAARTTATSHTDTTISTFAYTSHGPNTASYIHYYRLTPYDTLGNPGTVSVVGTTGQNSAVVRGFLSSPFYVWPNSSKTWRVNQWRSDAIVVDGTGVSERVIQGWTTNGENFGHFWYDTKQTGINPTSSFVYLNRTTDSGQGNSQPYICLSQAPSALVPSASSPTGYARTTPTIPPALNNTTGTAAFCQIDVSWITHLMDGATWRSILLYTGEASQFLTTGISRNYLVFTSRNEGGFGIVGGTLQINHTG